MTNRNTLTSFFKQSKKEQDRQKILIFDMHNLVFRTLFVAAFAAKKQLMSDEELWEYWRYLMINSLFNSIRYNQPNRVIIAVDAPNSWRKDLYKEYKANRKAARDNAVVDFDAFWPILDDFIEQLRVTFKNIYILKLDKCEADDIIAVIVKKESGDDTSITVISSDKDMVQLMKHPNVELFDPIKRKVVKSISPERDLQIKIIAGDKSDNIPSIKKRCAERTALKMLNEGLDIHLADPDVKANYERNTELIDFDCIPQDIIKRIDDVYTNYQLEKIDGMGVLMFLGRNNIKQFAENIEQYMPSLRQLS